MACSCPSEAKRKYYSHIQLWSEVTDGIPSGSAQPLELREVTVCSKCGTAEFQLSETEKRTSKVA
jgi:hypothetical protein